MPHHALLLHMLQTISTAGEAAQGAHSTAEANLLSAKQDQVYAHSLEDRANILNAEANSVALKRIQGSLFGAHMCVCTCVCVCDSWLGRPSLIPTGPPSPAHACPPSFPHPFSCCQPYSSPHLPPSRYLALTPTPIQLSFFSSSLTSRPTPAVQNRDADTITSAIENGTAPGKHADLGRPLHHSCLNPGQVLPHSIDKHKQAHYTACTFLNCKQLLFTADC